MKRYFVELLLLLMMLLQLLLLLSLNMLYVATWYEYDVEFKNKKFHLKS